MRSRLVSALLMCLICSAGISGGQSGTEEKDWIDRSNQYAQVLLRFAAKYSPERASSHGIDGLQEEITNYADRYKMTDDLRESLRYLQAALIREHDPRVQQDLQLLIDWTQQTINGQEISQKYEIPLLDVARVIFNGYRLLLHDTVSEDNRRIALVRLRKYAGVEPGFLPLAEQAKAYILGKVAPGRVWPLKTEVESYLGRENFYVDGIKDLLKKYRIDGYPQTYAKLKEQLADYNDWTTQDILPRARTDFRLPTELYAQKLKAVGITISAEQLAATARRAFAQYQREMQSIATIIAQQRNWKFTDYRDVIRELRKDQLVGEAIVPHYEQRLKDIEAIIRREHLLTLPSRPVRIRLATAAETANRSSPYLQGSSAGGPAVFVLPLTTVAQLGEPDDYTFSATSWTLTAHEARPGHELVDAANVEHGISLARTSYVYGGIAMAEGWALYAEHIIKPYLPLDGQLISLQWLLLRAARAFIDPELQLGKLTTEDAMRILTHDVVFSESFAKSEVGRYTFGSPGQAASYFYGYTQLLQLRREVEAKMGKRFDEMKYHDFLVSHMLSFDMLRKSVMEDFVKESRIKY